MASDLVDVHVIVNEAGGNTDIAVERQQDAAQTVEIDHRVAVHMARRIIRDPILTSVDVVINVDSVTVERGFTQSATTAAQAAAAGQLYGNALVSLSLNANGVAVRGKGHGKAANVGQAGVVGRVRQGFFGKCCCARSSRR